MTQLVRIPSPRPRAEGTPHVYIATPAHTLHANYVLGLVRSLPELLSIEVATTYALLSGFPHVDDARNLLVADFLKTDCTDLVFWDADVGASAAAITRLLIHQQDVVGGAYPLKQPTLQFPVKIVPGALADENGLLACKGVPTGFLRIKRHVLERLASKATKVQMIGAEIPIIFERLTIGNERMGGDYAFCHKWREEGGGVYIDTTLTLTHQGLHDFGGCYGMALRQRTTH